MDSAVTSISTVSGWNDNVWRTTEYRTISFADGANVIRVRTFSDSVELYNEKGYIENSNIGKSVDILAWETDPGSSE